MQTAPEVAKEKRNVSKQEAVRELRRDIEAMQKKGYTLDDIAKFLTDGGLEISTPTLKSYLQRTKTEKKIRTSGLTKATLKKPSGGNIDSEPSPVKAAVQKTKIEIEKNEEQTNISENKGGFEVRPDSDI
jgi:hypothetical protein